MPAMQAMRADIVPREARGKMFGLYNTFFNAGDILGPVISTVLYDIYRNASWNIGGITVPGYGIPFFVNSILGIITTSVLLTFVKETVDTTQRDKKRSIRLEAA